VLLSTCEEDLSLIVLRKSQTLSFLERVIQFSVPMELLMI
jgi:hypothetical protein